MKLWIWTGALSMLLWALLPVGTAAQLPPADTALTRVLEIARAKNSFVRVIADRQIEGRVSSLGLGVISLRTGDSMTVASIRQIDVREQGRSGALVGAVAGALTLGPAISYFLIGERGFRISGVNVMGIIGGSVIGGLAGALVYPGEVNWRTAWPR